MSQTDIFDTQASEDICDSMRVYLAIKDGNWRRIEQISKLCGIEDLLYLRFLLVDELKVEAGSIEGAPAFRFIKNKLF